MCYAISQPEDKEPKNVNRDPVYFFVSHRPKEGVRNEVSVITGYPYKPGSSTSVAIGPDKYSMFTKGDGAWINGGFFVLESSVLDYIEGDQTIWEREPMERLAHEGQMSAYRHDGFWQPMDTLRDKMYLEDLWESGDAPWRVWSA